MLVINKHNILTDAQHGCRDKSTEIAGQFFFKHPGTHEQTAICFRFIFFTYDVINHEILLSKLEYYAITGTIKPLNRILTFLLITICCNI
jgi:hypothetical protein